MYQGYTGWFKIKRGERERGRERERTSMNRGGQRSKITWRSIQGRGEESKKVWKKVNGGLGLAEWTRPGLDVAGTIFRFVPLFYRFEQFCYEYIYIYVCACVCSFFWVTRLLKSLNFLIDLRKDGSEIVWPKSYTALDLLILHQLVSPVHTILPYAIILTVHYREVKWRRRMPGSRVTVPGNTLKRIK